MIVLKTIDLRNDFKRVSDLVMSGERVLISRPRNENLVVISEYDYNMLSNGERNKAYSTMQDKSDLHVAESTPVYFTHAELDSVDKMTYDELRDVLLKKRTSNKKRKTNLIDSPPIPDEFFIPQIFTDDSDYIQNKIPRKSLRGILKGKVWMSDDFNDSSEEMEKYL